MAKFVKKKNYKSIFEKISGEVSGFQKAAKTKLF